jgi:hypothetical protein
MTSMLSKDFNFEVSLGEIALRQLKDEANLTLRASIPGKNISSFNTLKDKTKQKLAVALDKLMGKNKFDIYYEITQMGEPPKQIKTGSDLNKYLTHKPQSVHLTVIVCANDNKS